MKDKGRVLGLDLGARRIGVAVTDSDQRVATGVQVVHRGGDRQADHRAVAALVEEYEAVGLVVGLPLSMSGETGTSARAVLEEIDEIRTRIAVDVDTVDERLTTVAASGALRAGGRPARRQRTLIDQTAAAVILQTWVDRRRD